MWMLSGLLLVGLVLVVLGGELFVAGASRLAIAARWSPVFIGLTIVAYGTSTPELVVSASSALKGEAGVSLGNVVGSNIFNILLILGLSALVTPLKVQSLMVRRDIPIMVGVTALFVAFACDQVLQIWEGLILVAGLITYTSVAYYYSGKEISPELTGSYESTATIREPKSSFSDSVKASGTLLIGLLLLIGGCELFVRQAIELATYLKISPTVIGLTIVAAGTSLPELATSIIASYRNQREIALGNVIGSNIFNIFGVQGTACLCSQTGITIPTEMLRFDFPVMFLTALLCLPIAWTGHRISRPEGAVLTALYICYTVWLIRT